MKILPSRNLKKQMKMVTDDNEYVNDLKKRGQYLRGIQESMESPFGVILINALESVESNALENLYLAGNDMVARQAKAEIKIARYMKSTLMGYVVEQGSFETAIQQYSEMEQGEQYGD
jgi:hypothetical protein